MARRPNTSVAPRRPSACASAPRPGPPRPIAASRTSTAGAIASSASSTAASGERARESELIERQRVAIDEATHTDRATSPPAARPTSVCSTADRRPVLGGRGQTARAQCGGRALQNTVADTSSSPRRRSPRIRRCRVVGLPPCRPAGPRHRTAMPPSTPSEVRVRAACPQRLP